MLAAAVVAGERSPVLQVCDAVLDPDAAGGVRFAPAFAVFSYQSGASFLNLRGGRCHDSTAGLGTEPLIAGISKDLDDGPVRQEPDQP
ncbi:hypothetical protein [Streptomyces sp. NPDC058661]|uniref:hypothetical protein n=1 Tax=Streptomyces sp. NPDC058661 TaxID=3346582 RepID=UPI00364AD57B